MAGAANSPRDPQTPDQVVGEIEVAREQLALTIDALIDRTNPSNVARRTLAGIKAKFFAADGSPRVATFAQVGGAMVGVVVVLVVIRRVVGDR